MTCSILPDNLFPEFNLLEFKSLEFNLLEFNCPMSTFAFYFNNFPLKLLLLYSADLANVLLCTVALDKYLAVGECMHSKIWNTSSSDGSINVIFC